MTNHRTDRLPSGRTIDSNRANIHARYAVTVKLATNYQIRARFQYELSREMRACINDPLSVTLAIYHQRLSAVYYASARDYLNQAIFWRAMLLRTATE